MFNCLHIIYGCLHPMTTEWSSRSRDLRTTKLKIFTTCPCRKLYQPWLKQYHQESTFMSCLMVVVSSPSAWPLNNTGWEWLRCGFLSKKWSVVTKGRINSFWAGQNSRCLLLRLSSCFLRTIPPILHGDEPSVTWSLSFSMVAYWLRLSLSVPLLSSPK